MVDKRTEALKRAQEKYRKSTKGRATIRRYRATPKGRNTAVRAANVQYVKTSWRHSPEAIEKMRKAIGLVWPIPANPHLRVNEDWPGKDEEIRQWDLRHPPVNTQVKREMEDLGL